MIYSQKINGQVFLNDIAKVRPREVYLHGLLKEENEYDICLADLEDFSKISEVRQGFYITSVINAEGKIQEAFVCLSDEEKLVVSLNDSQDNIIYVFEQTEALAGDFSIDDFKRLVSVCPIYKDFNPESKKDITEILKAINELEIKLVFGNISNEDYYICNEKLEEIKNIVCKPKQNQ